MIDFDRMYEANWTPIFRYLYARSGDPDDAEEGAQEVFMRVFRLPEDKRIEGKSPEEQQRYLFTTARNYVAEGRRRGRPVRVPLPEILSETEGGSIADQLAEAEALGAAFLACPPRDREVLMLAFGLGLSLAQIANVLRISLSAARERRRVARHRLSLALMESGERLPGPEDWPQDRGSVDVEVNP